MRSRGSAPVDFVLVSVPLLFLTLSIVGVALNGFANNVAQEIAIDSARYGALADQDASAARTYAQNMLNGPLLRFFQSEVTAERISTSASCQVQVSVNLKTVAFGFLSKVFKAEETARAFCEIQQ